MPKWSTPIDFAYSIHSDLGNHIAFSKVNWRIVHLDYELSNWDTVDIVIDKNRHPLITWLSFVKTNRAKDVIKSYINKVNRDELIEKWKFILNSYLQKNFWIILDKELSILKNIDSKILDTKEKEDLIVQIWNLSRRPSSIIRSALESSNNQNLIKLKIEKPIQNKIEHKVKIEEEITDAIIIWWEKNIPYKIAHCCNPTKWDKIVWYMTRTGVNIHKTSCLFLRKWNFERFMQARYEWKEQKWITFKVELIFENKIGVLKNLTDILFHMDISIESLNTEKLPKNLVKNIMTLESGYEDYYIFERLVDRLKSTINEFKEAILIEIK